ncbi:MAG TPA: transglutaminase-like domain-containing protein [Planctomycetota bacterium]|jgi:hypothetical protein|nr:transglutaminase-like domain-containing protein [Planctomycetota bacterium]
MAHAIPTLPSPKARLPRRLAATLALVPLLLAAAFARARTGDDDVWQLMYFDDAKVGFVHMDKEHDEVDGKKVVRRTTDSSMTLNRLNQTISVIQSSWALEDENGEVLELFYESNMSQAKTVQHLVRSGATATIEQRIGKSSQKRTIDWNPVWLSEGAADKFQKEKLAKGEKEFSYQSYSLESGETTVSMKVVGKEKVDVKGSGPRELLHVKVENSVLPVATDAYLDEKFDDVMTVIKMMNINMTTVRSDKATCVAAFAKPDTPEIFDKISPRTNVRLPNPYRTDEVVLRLRASDPGTPMPKVEDERQTIVSRRDDRDVTLRIRKVVPTEKFTLPLSNLSDEEKECLKPSVQIENDNPELVKLAQDAIGDEKDAWAAAQKLEKFVNGYITDKNMSNLFESATGVMKSRAGDCTEHGVLLAGLCRAVGIPARVAIGFLYFSGIWGGHMWAEVSLGGKWYALDGVLGQGAVDAAHLRLGADSLATMQIEKAFQSVALGMTLKIDLESFRHGDREVKVGENFKPWTIDGRRFRSTLFGFTVAAPEGFEIAPNDRISLHDNLVVEFRKKDGGARIDVSDVTYDFTLEKAKDVVAGSGVTRSKYESRTIGGRPGLVINGKKGDNDVRVAVVLDRQTLIVLSMARKDADDDAAFEALVTSIAFADAM